MSVNAEDEHLRVTHHVSAYCDEGSFEEDAELCECARGKAVFLQGSCVLQSRGKKQLRHETALSIFTNTLKTGTDALPPSCVI